MNKSQLAELYGISRPTLNNWLKRVQLYKKYQSNFTPAELAEIFKRLGNPIDFTKKKQP